MSPECEQKIIDLLELLDSRVARLEQSVSQTGVERGTGQRSLQLSPRECVASPAEYIHPPVSEDILGSSQMCLQAQRDSGEGQRTVSRIRLEALNNAIETAGPGGPIAESSVPTHKRSKKQSLQQQVLAVTVKGTQKVDDDGDDDATAAKAVSEFLEHERDMWAHVKSTPFHQSLLDSKLHGTPLPFRHWLRLLLQFDTSLTVSEVLRIFDEEDSMLAMSLVIHPTEEWEMSHNEQSLSIYMQRVLHPASAMRTRWDIYVLLVMLALCLITPYTIGFDITPRNTSVIGVWEKIVDASFVLDIIFNFRTAYTGDEPTNFVVTSLRPVAVRYLKGFFVIDFLSTVPWDVVLANDGLGIFQLVKLSKLMKLLRMARALKLVRILRLIKAPMVLKQLENNMGRVYVHILSLACTVVVLLHLFACLFHYVTLWDESDTWVEASGIVNTSSIMDRYLSSLYWAMSTMATVGYGDITPILIPEKLVAMAGMLCGVTVFAYVTSTVSSLLTTFNTQSMRTQEQQRNIDAFCRGHRLPKPLARKLSGFYDYVLPKMIHKEDTSIIARLPDTLQQQVILTINAQLFDKLPVFKEMHPQILQHLLPKLELEYYLANEYVIWQGDRAIRMFFLGDGIIEVRRAADTGATTDGKSPKRTGGKNLIRSGTKQRADDLWKRAASSKDPVQNVRVQRRTHNGVVANTTGAPVEKPICTLTENLVRRSAASAMMDCVKRLSTITKSSSTVHPQSGNLKQLQSINSALSTKSALLSSGSGRAVQGKLKRQTSDDGARATKVSFMTGYSERESDAETIEAPNVPVQQQLSNDDASVHQASGDSASVVPTQSSVDSPCAVEVDLQQRLSGSNSAADKVEILNESPAVPAGGLLDFDARHTCAMDRVECATEVTQDHSDGGTAECQLAQHNLESTPEHLNEPQDNQDFESNSPDPSQPLLLSGNAQGNAASDSGSFDVPPLDGDVQRFTKQDTSNPCLSGEDGPAGAVEAMPVAESTMGNTAEHHVSDGGRRASAAHSVDSENLEPQLMQRMIGISTAPFQRLGRLKRGAHFGERDCLYGTEPAVSMVTVTACGPNRDAHPEHLAGQVDLAGLLDTSAALPEVSICGIHADKSPSDAGSHSNSAPGFGDNQAEIDQVSSVERIAKAAARNRRGDAAQP